LRSEQTEWRQGSELNKKSYQLRKLQPVKTNQVIKITKVIFLVNQ